MGKYIDADLLIRKIRGQIRLENLNFAALGGGGQTFCINTLEWVLKQIDSLQQEQPKKYIELNGIKYREVSAKTNDKICKDCDYFLDNGTCELVDCPCIDDNTILERLNEQPEVDLEKEIEWEWAHREKQEVDLIECAEMDKEEFVRFARHFYELGLNARKED